MSGKTPLFGIDALDCLRKRGLGEVVFCQKVSKILWQHVQGGTGFISHTEKFKAKFWLSHSGDSQDFPPFVGVIAKARNALSWTLGSLSISSSALPPCLLCLLVCSASSSARQTDLAQKMFRSFIHAIISSLLRRSAMFAGVSPATAGVSVSIWSGEENIPWGIQLAWGTQEDSVSTCQRLCLCKRDVLVRATYCCSRAGWHLQCEEPSGSTCRGSELQSGQACRPTW